jgi:hypothetical protein
VRLEMMKIAGRRTLFEFPFLLLGAPLLVAPDIALVLPRTFDLKRAITVSRPILATDTTQPGHETMS